MVDSEKLLEQKERRLKHKEEELDQRETAVKRMEESIEMERDLLKTQRERVACECRSLSLKLDEMKTRLQSASNLSGDALSQAGQLQEFAKTLTE